MTWDSRAVKPGDLYVALPGERVDGHDFAATAVAAGAVAVLASREIEVDVPVILVEDKDVKVIVMLKFPDESVHVHTKSLVRVSVIERVLLDELDV